MKRFIPILMACVCLSQQAAADTLELPPQVNKPIPYQRTVADRIRDRWEDPKTVYQKMRTGEYDREPMDEVQPAAFEEKQLPEPTVVPAAPPSAVPVVTIPAQRMVQPKAVGEDQIFTLIHGEVTKAQDLQSRLQQARERYDAAPVAPLRRIAEQLQPPAAVEVSSDP